MADLSTRYMGLSLKNPLIAGSSGLTNSVDNIRKISDQGAGAIVLKSLFEEQIQNSIQSTFAGNAANYGYPEAMDYIANYTHSRDLEQYLALIREAKKVTDIPVIASVNCVSSVEWISFAKRIEDAGADGLELNIFTLPSDPKKGSEDQEKLYFDIAMSIIKQVKIPVAMKISFYFSGFANMILKLSWTGISGIVMFNRYYSPDIDIEKIEITSTNVFSYPEEYTLPLRWIALLSEKLHCDIAASTGVHDGATMIKLLLAGAKAVQVTSTLYKHGFEIIPVMLNDLNSWMERHNFAKTSDFVGKMSYKSAENPAAYERVQFMKHFSGID